MESVKCDIQTHALAYAGLGEMDYWTRIHSLILNVRDHVNLSWKHYQLCQDKASFSQLCSAMDILQDSADAIHAFGSAELPDTKPVLYLTTYGVLQALFLQQDAVRHLAEALAHPVDLKNWPVLQHVRDIRNFAVGHPTKKDRPKPASFHHITQMTLSREGFDLLSFYDNGESKHQRVDLPHLIAEQQKVVCAILLDLVKQLQLDEIRHQESFRMEKLEELLPQTIHYWAIKVLEAVDVHGEPRLGLTGLEIVSSAAVEFRNAVERRDMSYYESLEHQYLLIQHALSELRAFFEEVANQQDPSLSRLTAEILAMFLHTQIEQLVECAWEIDDDYSD